MKKVFSIYILLCLTCLIPVYGEEPDNSKRIPGRKSKPESTLTADSIMQEVIRNAARYQNALSKYEADIYIKGRTEILRKNFLMRFAHHLFPVNRKSKDMIFEMVSHSEFNSPNFYLHDIEALNGNAIPNRKKQEEALTFLNLNVYAPTAYEDGFIMPVARKAFRYYNFSLEEVEEVDGLTIYKIRFLPKQWSRKLVCGDMYIIDEGWTIDRMEIIGQSAFAQFNVEMSFGRDYQHFMLPEKADLTLRYQVMGNTVLSTYHSAFTYRSVEWDEDAKRKRKPLNLTQYYRISSDTIPIIEDSTYWEVYRDQPLTPDEKRVYNTPYEKEFIEADTSDLTNYIQLTEKFTSSMTMNFKDGRFKYYGFLNPFQLGYSGRNGLTYKQKIRVDKTFNNGTQIRFRPEAGYVFKRKEFYYRISTDWYYKPEKLGYLSLVAENRSQSYSSEMMDIINEHLRDSILNFKELDLIFFKNHVIELRNNIELFNGFQLSAGTSYHRRLPAKKNKYDLGEDMEEVLNDVYHDFIPFISVSYTPRQYYRMDGRRKEYVFSRYPTISVEFAKSIPGVMQSTGNYDRIEADVHQSIPIGGLRKLNYHVSAGTYTREKSTFFADFRYFARRNFPETWEDQLGGVFNQLSRYWYNASDKYFQTHLMYQSPFILFQLFNPNASRHIVAERFYYSYLWTPALPHYSEIGYGVGNHIFNIGVFAGVNKWEFNSIGLKFAFELFQ